MENRFPMNSKWVETPKVRKRLVSHEEKKKASSAPTTPLQNNHFDVLSPPSSPSSQKKKKKKRPRSTHSSASSIRSPLSHEITHEWDDHIVPCNEMEGLHILRNLQEDTQEQATQPIEALRQISFLDYLKDELTVADFDSAQELKRERVTNFLGVPAAIEKVLYKPF